MRTQDSICLLCLNNKATQKNSHILPKFITKSILGGSKIKRGVEINTDVADRHPRYVQDSDKEDYMLCPTCESYFSLLETYIANNFQIRLRNNAFTNQFIDYKIDETLIRKCLEINPIIFRIFIYSILWRCSTSTNGIFENFRLNPDEEELLRTILTGCKCDTQKELFTTVENSPTIIPIPFVMITPQSLNDVKGIVAWFGLENPYYLFLNEYLLILSFNNNKEQAFYKGANNFDNSEIKITFFNKDFWNEQKSELIKLGAKMAKKTLEQKGKTAWASRQE